MLPAKRLVPVVLWVASALAGVTHAQWSADPSVNLAIADRTADQVQPKIRSTSDGGCYMSWFDNAAGGYEVYLQRVDPQGYETAISLYNLDTRRRPDPQNFVIDYQRKL